MTNELQDTQSLKTAWVDSGLVDGTDPETAGLIVGQFLYWVKSMGYKILERDNGEKVQAGSILPIYRIVAEHQSYGTKESCDIAIDKGDENATVQDALLAWEHIVYGESWHVLSVTDNGSAWVVKVKP